MCSLMSEWGREAKATLWPGLTGKTNIQAHLTQGKEQREAGSYVARWCRVTALLNKSAGTKYSFINWFKYTLWRTTRESG